MNNNLQKFLPVYITLSALTALIILIYIIPFELSQTIKTKAKLYPYQEWTITKGDDGRLTSVNHNYYMASTENFTLNIFERGDAVQFTINPKLRPGSYVSAGDTIGSIYSNHFEQELAQLQGELAAQRASLLMNETGEKASLIKMAREELAAAIKQTQLQNSVLDRKKTLFESALISQEKYDIELAKYEIYEKNTQIARAQLVAISTGEKTELLEFIQTQINALSREIEIYQNRKDRYHLRAPFNGVFSLNFSADTLAQIRDLEKMVAVFLVPFEELQNLKTGSNVKLNSNLNNIEITAQVLMLDNSIHVYNDRQMVLGTAGLNHYNNMVLPGLLMECEIESKPVLLRHLVTKFVFAIFSWE